MDALTDAKSVALNNFKDCIRSAVAALAKAAAPRVATYLRVAALIIGEQAGKPWTCEISDKVDGFFVDTPQSEIQLNPSQFGSICIGILNRIKNSNDTRLVAIRDELGDGEKLDRVIMRCFATLFISHEFLHVIQKLGSYQYKDSDTYMRAVMAIDYQADIVAIERAMATLGSKSLLKNDTDLLILLVAIHISCMRAFSLPSESQDDDIGSTMERLLLWSFQWARMAATNSFQIMHPSFLQAPTIEFPQLGTAWWRGHEPALPSNMISQSRQDMVISLANSDGLIGIVRFGATDPKRSHAIVKAVLGGDFIEVRNTFQEIFEDRPQLINFKLGGKLQFALAQIYNAQEKSRIIVDSKDIFSLASAAVLDLISHVNYIFFELDVTKTLSDVKRFVKKYPRGTSSFLDEHSNYSDSDDITDASGRLKIAIRQLLIRLDAIEVALTGAN